DGHRAARAARARRRTARRGAARAAGTRLRLLAIAQRIEATCADARSARREADDDEDRSKLRSTGARCLEHFVPHHESAALSPARASAAPGAMTRRERSFERSFFTQSTAATVAAASAPAAMNVPTAALLNVP